MNRIVLTTLLLSLSFAFSAKAGAQPSVQFAELEHRLLAANELSLNFHVSASGAVQASIDGVLSKNTRGDIHLSAAGIFAGQNIDLVVMSDEQGFNFGNREELQSAEPPAELLKALILGFTRMGILHNIANLSAGAIPDHAEGGVEQWVLVSNVQNGASSYNFDIIVADIPSGSAAMTIDETGNPIMREQTVVFPGGEMKVVETYSNVSLSE